MGEVLGRVRLVRRTAREPLEAQIGLESEQLSVGRLAKCLVLARLVHVRGHRELRRGDVHLCVVDRRVVRVGGVSLGRRGYPYESLAGMADVEAAAGVFGVFRHGRIKPKLAVFVPHEVVRKVNLLGNVVVASKDLRVEVEPAFSVGLARAVVMANPWRDLAHVSGRRALRTLVVAGR